MSFASGYFKIKINVNPLGSGGHNFYTPQPSLHNGIWGQIWTGDYSDKPNPFGTERLPSVHSILLYYPENNKFEPGRNYIIKVFIRSYEPLDKHFAIGKKFDIRIGHLYDDKYWATGEILEILENQ